MRFLYLDIGTLLFLDQVDLFSEPLLSYVNVSKTFFHHCLTWINLIRGYLNHRPGRLAYNLWNCTWVTMSGSLSLSVVGWDHEEVGDQHGINDIKLLDPNIFLLLFLISATSWSLTTTPRNVQQIKLHPYVFTSELAITKHVYIECCIVSNNNSKYK